MKSKPIVAAICSTARLITGAAVAQQDAPAQTDSISNITNLQKVNA